jgi:hypothetical protein
MGKTLPVNAENVYKCLNNLGKNVGKKSESHLTSDSNAPTVKAPLRSELALQQQAKVEAWAATARRSAGEE